MYVHVFYFFFAFGTAGEEYPFPAVRVSYDEIFDLTIPSEPSPAPPAAFQIWANSPECHKAKATVDYLSFSNTTSGCYGGLQLYNEDLWQNR